MKVAFLGYSRQQTTLITALESSGCSVFQTEDPVDDFSDFDLVVSFGFKHIIGKKAIATARRPILNLHISLLPFNRGYHPNFWAHIDGTPSGVTIHEIDPNVDTGSIVLQKKVDFPKELNDFSSTYAFLIETIEAVFRDNLKKLLSGDYQTTPQIGEGTFHFKRELPEWMTDWDMPIEEAKRRFRANSEQVEPT